MTAGAVLAAGVAQAQGAADPNRPIKLVVGFPPGGSDVAKFVRSEADTFARIVRERNIKAE